MKAGPPPVERAGCLDHTHRAIFTPVSLAALLRSQGFVLELVRARFLHSPFEPLAGQMLIARKP